MSSKCKVQKFIVAWKMSSIDGRMFHFSKSDKNLVAFVSLNTNSDQKPCKNAVLLVPGQEDGFMSMAYAPSLSKALLAKGFSLVQAQISSSFMQFGFSSIEKDCEELTLLVSYLKEELAFETIVFIGHSTGAQDAIYFLRHSPVKKLVSAVILQGAVGDRDIIHSQPPLLEMLEEARRLREEGKEKTILTNSLDLYNAPLMASRYLSFGERLGKEDMFSVDLTEEELSGILEPICIPIMLCFSTKDEFIPDHPAQRELAKRMVKVLKAQLVPVVECKDYDGDHGLTTEAMYSPFVEDVMKFILSLSSSQ